MCKLGVELTATLHHNSLKNLNALSDVDVRVFKHLKQKGREENLITGGRLLRLLGILQKPTVTSNRLG